MKKYIFIISTLLLVLGSNSCSERDLELIPPQSDEITNIQSEKQLQMLLNGGYLTFTSSDLFGTKAMLYGDLMSDNLFVSIANSAFLSTFNFNFNASQQKEFLGFYSGLYNVIASCNLVINNTSVSNSANVTRLRGEAKILRAFAYFTLVSYYSAAPITNANQEYGVPLVLENYNANLKLARATVPQVYTQIIKDLNEAIVQADATPSKKIYLSQTAAKLLLSRVYITRRAAGDAQLAIQLADEVIATANVGGANPSFTSATATTVAAYAAYFSGSNDAIAENHAETVWELELSKDNFNVTGIGVNVALPAYYNRTDQKKALLFNQTFYASMPVTDVRKGTGPSALLTATGVPDVDSPKGYWTNKYPKFSTKGNYFRNIKMLRYSEAYLNKIEALMIAGQPGPALVELNKFALSRKGNTYTGTNLLQDIMSERGKEFYGEGQRFLDLKRNNLPVVRPSNCGSLCTLPVGDKRFVIPVSEEAMNANGNLTQYPGY